MIISNDISQFLISEEATVEEALRRISANRRRAVIVVTDEGQLVGSLTDGDFRRWLTSQTYPTLTTHCSEVANPRARWARRDEHANRISALFEPGIDLIPLLDDRLRVVAVAIPRGREIHIDGRRIASDEPTYVIAEIGINHNGSRETSFRLIDAAIDAGADCVKFQLRDIGSLYRETIGGMSSEDLGAQYTLDLINENALATEDLLEAMSYVKGRGATPLCTPWDLESARILIEFGMKGFKIASADLTNHGLIRAVAESGRPLIVSTGMSTEAEISETIELLRSSPSAFALLQCNSAYPSPYKDVNLLYMDRLQEFGDCVVGYSGHERGHHVAVAAVARGASIIEKHITLDRRGRGNDHIVSLEPPEFARMVREIREVEAAIGNAGPRVINQGEALNRLSLSKSLVATRDLTAGEAVTPVDIDVRSPGRGVQPNRIDELVGKVLARDVLRGDFFYASDIEGTLAPARSYSFDRPWGLPVRFHDWAALAQRSNPDFLEFHLSYRDMEMNLADAIPDKLKFDLYVHSPDLFADDHILDLSSLDSHLWNRSIHELQRVVDLTREMIPKFPNAKKPVIIVSMGGSTQDEPVHASGRSQMYERVMEALSKVDTEGVNLLAQTLPPFPWYLGGQRHCNLFVEPAETADFSRQSGVGLCFDTAHTKLACNYLKSSFSEAVELLAPHSRHLHLVDAAGLDSEGLQVGEGEIDWRALGKQLATLASGVSFIPEIWQGHADGGVGFWTALNRLEGIL